MIQLWFIGTTLDALYDALYIKSECFKTSLMFIDWLKQILKTALLTTFTMNSLHLKSGVYVIHMLINLRGRNMNNVVPSVINYRNIIL